MSLTGSAAQCNKTRFKLQARGQSEHDAETYDPRRCTFESAGAGATGTPARDGTRKGVTVRDQEEGEDEEDKVADDSSVADPANQPVPHEARLVR